jgi:hypothetical protein
MGLYLHNIWIHWLLHFHEISFDQEDTDTGEAWFAVLKRIMKYLTDRKKENALLELIFRTSMEHFVTDQTKSTELPSQNKISKAFETYQWEEFFISKELFNLDQQAQQDISAFLQLLQQFEFQQGQDYDITSQGIHFNTLPLSG